MASRSTDSNNQKEKNQRQLALNASSARTISEEPSDAKQSEDSLYLSNGKYCAQENSDSNESESDIQTRRVTALLPCYCRNWYCSVCAGNRGRRLRGQLIDRLKEFKGVFGITLTIDGELYNGPYDAWLDVTHRRLISRFVKKLFDKGFLVTRDYFWVVEFQQHTEQPHWHLLVNTRRIPFGVIVELWSACRPRSAPKLPFRVTKDNYSRIGRPAFGSVRFSFPANASPIAAACYATKYLIKTPEYGFPDWVLDHEGKSKACTQGRVHRLGHSQGFFPKHERMVKDECDRNEADAESTKKRKSYEYHSPDCLCDICLGIEEDLTGTVRMRPLKTIRDRINDCQQKTASFSVDATMGKDIKPSIANHKYDRTLNIPFEKVKSNLESLAEDEKFVLREIGPDLDLMHQQHLHEESLDQDKKDRGQDQW